MNSWFLFVCFCFVLFNASTSLIRILHCPHRIYFSIELILFLSFFVHDWSVDIHVRGQMIVEEVARCLFVAPLGPVPVFHGFHARRRFKSRPSHTRVVKYLSGKQTKNVILRLRLLNASRYGVSARTYWSGNSIIWLSEIAVWTCYLCVGVTAHKHVLGCYGS